MEGADRNGYSEGLQLTQDGEQVEVRHMHEALTQAMAGSLILVIVALGLLAFFTTAAFLLTIGP